MKINRFKLFGLVVAAVGLLASCDTDNVSTIYDVTTPNISFVDAESETLTADASATVKVMVSRFGKSGTYTAHYTGVASEDDIFTDLNNGEVTFNDGESVAYINLKAEKMEKGNDYTYTITLSNDDIATKDETIGDPITKTIVTVTCDYTWEYVGTGTYMSPYMFEAEWEQDIYRAQENPNLYKFDWSEMGDSGFPMYDLKFTIDENGNITVPFQKGWNYPGYGDVYVAGNYNDDIAEDEPSFLAGTFDAEIGVMEIGLWHYLAIIDYAFGTAPDYFIFAEDTEEK